MNRLKTQWIEERIPYTGLELRSHFALEKWDIEGDNVIAFIGECNVPKNHLVDLLDAKTNAVIYSPLMLHFLGEFFNDNLERAIWRQRLFVTILKERCEALIPKLRLQRKGNDLYDGGKKLNVSIATATPLSTLLHIGVNIETQGTPVATAGLRNYNIDSVSFAKETLQQFAQEMDGVYRDLCKVRSVP
ncbi:MAG: DUF366 family protein [Deltaproteobacteria bacterium]|nr:DUF366 family protein [Deltaproteobacteria bacterium]